MRKCRERAGRKKKAKNSYVEKGDQKTENNQ